MLFNSYFFLFVFLPVALLGYHLLRKAPFRLSLAWLVGVSVVLSLLLLGLVGLIVWLGAGLLRALGIG